MGRDSEPCRDMDGVDTCMDPSSVCGLSKGTAMYWVWGMVLPGTEHEVSLPHPFGGFCAIAVGMDSEQGRHLRRAPLAPLKSPEKNPGHSSGPKPFPFWPQAARFPLPSSAPAGAVS